MSHSLAKRLSEVSKKPLDSIAIIPQYCEDFYAQPADCSALRRQFGDKFHLIFTGNFSPAQSLETVIEAICIAQQKGFSQLHLILVGDGMSRPALEKLVKDKQAEEFITFYGSVPPQKIPEFCALADGLICPLADSPDLGMTIPAKLASYMASWYPHFSKHYRRGCRSCATGRLWLCYPGRRCCCIGRCHDSTLPAPSPAQRRTRKKMLSNGINPITSVRPFSLNSKILFSLTLCKTFKRSLPFYENSCDYSLLQ